MSLKYRPMALIGFTVLTVLLISISVYDGFSVIAIAVGTVLFAVTLVFKKIREQIFPFFLASALMLSGALFLLCDVKTDNTDALAGNTYELCGRICEYESYGNSRYYYTLDDVKLDGSKVNSKLNLSLPESAQADIYDTLKIDCVRIYSAGGTNKSAKLYYHSKDIFLGAYADNEDTYSAEVEECTHKPLMYGFKKANRVITQRISEKIPNEYGAIVIGMLTGNKDLMSDETVEIYTKAGIASLFAVSGFHLSVWIMGLYTVLRSFGVRKRINSVVAVITTVCFMLLTGLSASVCRAGIMMIVILVGNMFYRKSDSINSLGLAVAVMCIVNPYNAMNTGFLLSVTATLGIVVIYPSTEKYILSRLPENLICSILKAFLSMILVCISAIIGVMPATILFIGDFSVMTVLSNLAVSFVAGFCMFFGGLTALLYPFNILSDFTAFLCEYTAKYIYTVLKFISSFGTPLVSTSDIYWHAGAILCTVVVISSLMLNEKIRTKVTCVALTVTVAVCSVCSYIHYDGLTNVKILNVGGSVLIIASDNSGKIVLCNEAGYEYYSDDAVEALNSINFRKSDFILVPTYDATINPKVISLVKNYEFLNVVAPFESRELKRYCDKTLVTCNVGNFEVLETGIIDYCYGDDYSVALCNFNNVSMLVIFECRKKSDIPDEYLDAQVLVCTGKIPDCIDVTRYNEVIVSAGKVASDTVHKYVNNYGVEAVTTAENGNIDIEIKNQDYKITVEEGV